MTPPDDVLAARLQGVLDVPLHRWLGVRLDDPGEPRAGIVLPVGPSALNNAGLLHGGIVSALLDVAAYVCLLPDLAPEENAVTHDATSSLMRAVHEGSTVHLSATVNHRGRSVAFLRSQASVEGRVVAIGQVTKTIVRPR